MSSKFTLSVCIVIHIVKSKKSCQQQIVDQVYYHMESFQEDSNNKKTAKILMESADLTL